MTLNEYIKLLQSAKKIHGGKITVITAGDEGNSYNDILYAPTIMNTKDIHGFYSGEGDGLVLCVN